MSDEYLFEKFEGGFETLFNAGDKYTFLAGAGVSMDSPTNMPSARGIVRDLLEMCAPPEEVENLLSLNMLRYELIVEKIQNEFDDELKFMDYLEQVTQPNLIHLFLANVIIQGNYVITTNFDYLIEHALMRFLEKDRSQRIIPVITKEDFQLYQHPNNIINANMYPLYKIHGSKRNIIKNKDTKESLITTISALGREREEGKTFAIEPYKKPAVYNLMKQCTLVVIGYSGSDDFDIGPMLKELPFLKRVIWIEHTQSDQYEVFEVDKNKVSQEKEILSHLEQLLIEINSGGAEVFLIKANTGSFIQNRLWNIFCETISTKDLNVIDSTISIPLFSDWVKILYKYAPLIKKYKLANQIFYSLKQIDATTRCSENGLKHAEEINDLSSKSYFINFLGLVSQIQGNYDKAIQYYDDALQIDELLEDLDGKATDLSNIGTIYLTWGRYDEALEKYKEALVISEQLGDLYGKANHLNNIGRIHEIRGEFEIALGNYKEALKITEQLGDLGRKAALLNNIGMIHNAQNEFNVALEQYEEALQIAVHLGDPYGKIILLNNIGRIYDEYHNYSEALEKYEETVRIANQLGDLSKKAGCLNNIGSIYLAQEKYDEALNLYQEALNIEEKLGDPLMKAIYLNNIGMIYDRKKEFKSALKNYEPALKIVTELGDETNQALFLTKVGSDYMFMEQLDTALKNFELAVQLFEKLGDNSNKAATLSNIGRIYESQGKHNKALEIYEKTLEIDNQIGDSYGLISDLNNIGRVFEILGNFHEAMKRYEGALQISTQLGQNQYIEMIQNKITELESKKK